MLRCSLAGLSKNTASLRHQGQRTTCCLCGHQGRKRNYLACFHWRKREHASRIVYTKSRVYDFCVPPSRCTADNPNTWVQYKKLKIQAPGTTCSNCSDELRLEGGCGECGRLGTLTGVHQKSSYRPLPIFGFMGRL